MKIPLPVHIQSPPASGGGLFIYPPAHQKYLPNPLHPELSGGGKTGEAKSKGSRGVTLASSRLESAESGAVKQSEIAPPSCVTAFPLLARHGRGASAAEAGARGDSSSRAHVSDGSTAAGWMKSASPPKTHAFGGHGQSDGAYDPRQRLRRAAHWPGEWRLPFTQTASRWGVVIGRAPRFICWKKAGCSAA